MPTFIRESTYSLVRSIIECLHFLALRKSRWRGISSVHPYYTTEQKFARVLKYSYQATEI